MTDDANMANTDRLSMIMTKLERESRFTRIVVVICTIANLTVFVFGLMQTFEALPATCLAYFLENMEPIMQTQKCIEVNKWKHGAAKVAAPAADKPAADKEAK